MRIPIIFGWLHFHRKEQWLKSTKPYLVCHFYTAQWLAPYVNLHSKRLFCWCKLEDFTGHSEF